MVRTGSLGDAPGGPPQRVRPRGRAVETTAGTGSTSPHRTRLPAEVAEQLDEARRLLGSSPDLTQMTASLTDLIAGWYGAGCALALVEGDRAVWHAVGHADPARRAAAVGALLDRAVPLSEIHTLLDHRPTLVAEDVARLPVPSPYRRLAEEIGARSAMLIQLVAGQRLVGVLLIYADRPAALGHVQRSLLEDLAAEAAQAIEDARKRQWKERRRQRTRAIVTLLRAQLAGEPLDDLLLAALRAIVDASPAEVTTLFLYPEEIPENRRLFQHGPDDQLLVACTAAAALSWEDCPTERRMVETRSPQFVDADVAWVVDLPGSADPYPHCLIVPVMTSSQVLGALYLYGRGPLPFTGEDADFVAEVMAPLAAAIEQQWLRRERALADDLRDRSQDLADRLNLAPSPRAIADIAVQECAAAFGSGKASLYLAEPGANRLALTASVGLPVAYTRQVRYIGIGTGPVGAAAEERTLVVSEDLGADERWPHFGSIAARAGDPHAIWAVPLIADDVDVLGTLAVHHASRRVPGKDELALLTAIAGQVARALKRALLGDRTRELYHTTVLALAAAVDAKDPTADGHSAQVAAYSRRIAQALELPAAEVELIELAGLLHDIGKVGVPARMLQKADRLDPAEWAVIQRHPDIGAGILAESPLLAPLVPMVRHHHERYDGQGYPDRLAGEAIPLGAAIVGLAEAFETMIAGRAYYPAITIDAAIAEIVQASGTQFHPRVVAAFLRTLESAELGAVQVAPRVSPAEARPVIGFEARAFTLLQQISAELSALVDIGRFLRHLCTLLEAEFTDSICDIFFVDTDLHDLVNIAPSWIKSETGRSYVIKEGLGIIGWVAEHGVAQNVGDVLLDPRYITPPNGQPMRSEIAVPLLVDGRCVGVLNLESPRVAAYSVTDQQVLEMVATYVAQAIEVANLHDRLKRQADLDPMTELLNHRAFYARLEQELARAEQAGTSLAVVILDADGLKAINDSAGHLAGDAVIRALAQHLAAHVRLEETLARYGGDEFAIVAPQATAAMLEERLQAIDRALTEQAEPALLPTLSWGIATFPEDGRRATELVARADAAMYARKRQRRAAAGIA